LSPSQPLESGREGLTSSDLAGADLRKSQNHYNRQTFIQQDVRRSYEDLEASARNNLKSTYISEQALNTVEKNRQAMESSRERTKTSMKILSNSRSPSPHVLALGSGSHPIVVQSKQSNSHNPFMSVGSSDCGPNQRGDVSTLGGSKGAGKIYVDNFSSQQEPGFESEKQECTIPPSSSVSHLCIRINNVDERVLEAAKVYASKFEFIGSQIALFEQIMVENERFSQDMKELR